LSLGAQRLVCLHAEVARKARSVDPLDTDVVTNIDLADKLTACNNDTRTFVAANKRKLGWKGPVAVQGVEIGVTDTSVLDIDEDLIGTRLGNGDLLVLEWAASLLDDLSPLLLGDLRRRHCQLVSS
jgi:hypothetical protein